jgi:hypothetical protein
MTLTQRILRENRTIIAALLIGLLGNAALYLLAVRPLAARSASAEDRARIARETLEAARADLEAAQALVDGKALAEQELATFYDKVLPANLSAARSMTYAALPAMADRTNVRYDQRRTAVELVKDQRLGRLQISMVLQGDYERVRQFIYELETTPAFVIIDNVTLAQGDPDRPLALSVALSVYYRTELNAN